MLQVHMNEYHRETSSKPASSQKASDIESANFQGSINKTKAVKCPHCYQKFGEAELETHIAKEHFM